MKINAAEESFELMELFGKTVLFTNMRVDGSTVFLTYIDVCIRL